MVEATEDREREGWRYSDSRQSTDIYTRYQKIPWTDGSYEIDNSCHDFTHTINILYDGREFNSCRGQKTFVQVMS